MGIFDFLKGIVKEKEVEEAKKERIAFSDIPDYIENKRKELEIREKKTLDLIKDRIGALTIRIKEKINFLKKVDIESKKVEDRIKYVVKEGRKEYIEMIEFLLNDLNNLKGNKLEKIIFNIDTLFLLFNRSSHLSYERTTILIGKEMEDIKNELKFFSKELINLFNENKQIIHSFETIPFIELELKQFKKVKEEINKINQSIVSIDRQINFKEEQNKKTLEEIERIKKNPEHLEYLKRLEKVKSLETDLEKDIQILRQLIDFKALGNFFHIFENKMKIINLYKENFQKNFQQDNGKEILDLLNTANLVTKEVSDIIKKTNNKKEELLKDKIQNEKDEQMIQRLYSESSSMILKINDLKNEKIQEEKLVKRLNASEQEIISKIKEVFEKLGVFVN